jgi:ketol-acid reductoisomerase
MRHSISDTAEYGDYTAGPKIVTAQTRAAMKQILEDIQDGTFATAWIAEAEQGQPNFQKMREADRHHPIEQVGVTLRAMMPFLDPVTVPEPVAES